MCPFKNIITFLMQLFVCLVPVSRPKEAQEPGAADPVRTSAGLGGRQHEEPGTSGLYVSGPCEKWGQ